MTRMSVLEAWTWINEYGSAIGAVAGVVAALVAIIALISAALDSKARSQPMIAAEFRRTLSEMPVALRREDDQLREAARSALRKAVGKRLRKRPMVEVHLLRL